MAPKLFSSLSLKVPATTLQALSAGNAGRALGPSGRSNAFRDASRFVRKWGLKWNIQPSYYHYSKDTIIPYLSPRAMVGHLLAKCPQLLFGGIQNTQDAQQQLLSFWEGYRSTHSDHQVFETHNDYLMNVLPMLWHGDEGRGVRRGNTAVSTLESPFGLDSYSEDVYDRCDCCTPDVDPELWKRQNVNLKYHSFLTKFLVFAIPKRFYKGNSVIMDLCKIIALELRSLFHEGIFINGKLWFVALLGLKGDMAWFLKVAELERCYNRLSTLQDKACCHECLAGQAGTPFEDTSRNPAWKSTRYVQRPWRQAPSSGLMQVPFDRSAPEKVLRRDIFHASKVGTYQDYIAGSILLVAELGYFDDASQGNSRQKILQRMHGHFRLYCSAAGKSPALMSFSKGFLNVPSRKHYGWAKCKGSDATLLMEWISVMAGSCLNKLLNEDHRATLLAIRTGAQAGNKWLDQMYKHGLWWTPCCAVAINELGRKFVQRYTYLAWVCLHKWKFPAFAMKPKLHMLCHTIIETDEMVANNSGRVLSCLAFNCEANEDAIGRLSRISRKVHQARVCERVIEMYLTKAHALFKRYVRNPMHPGAPNSKKRKHPDS